MARNETKDTIVIALCATAVISMTIGPLVYALVGEAKYSNQEKVLCEQIKEDTNLHSFRLDNYVLENLDENYF